CRSRVHGGRGVTCPSRGCRARRTRARCHTRETEVSPHCACCHSAAERRDTCGRHAWIPAVGGVCVATAPCCRVSTPTPILLLRSVPGDPAAPFRAPRSWSRALPPWAGLPHLALLGRWNGHRPGGTRRTGLRHERLRARRLRRLSARRRRPSAARHVLHVPESAKRQGGR